MKVSDFKPGLHVKSTGHRIDHAVVVGSVGESALLFIFKIDAKAVAAGSRGRSLSEVMDILKGASLSLDYRYLPAKASVDDERFCCVNEGDVHHWELFVSGPLKCITCDELYPYAEPNRPDGRLQCFACRSVGRRERVVVTSGVAEPPRAGGVW